MFGDFLCVGYTATMIQFILSDIRKIVTVFLVQVCISANCVCCYAEKTYHY